MNRQFSLSWGRLLVVLIGLSVMPALLVYGNCGRGRCEPAGLALAVIWLSLASFIAFRWSKLRTRWLRGGDVQGELSTKPLSTLAGPPLAILVWILATISILIVAI